TIAASLSPRLRSTSRRTRSASRAQKVVGDVADVEQNRESREQPRAALDTRVERAAAPVRALRLAGLRGRPRGRHLISGGSSNVWCGAGDGTVHSRPCAPSQTCAVAFGPPRAHLMIT